MHHEPRADDLAAPAIDRLAPFDYHPRTRVVFGNGTVDRLGELARELGARRVFLVTDKGLARAGHERHGVEALKRAGLEVVIHDDVHPDPTTADVDRALAVAREGNIDLIVGLGGGSSMDCAKGVNFLLTNGGTMRDYWGVGKATKPMLPMIAVPTTAGTGSEAQSFAVIADAETHMKMACGDKKAACKIALLDPELTLSMPPAVTAATGIDALSHAVESFVTKARTPVSQLFSRQAWRLLSAAFLRVLDDPADREARGAMLLGSHLAGAAIENSMLGATHSLANPLSARYGITHGVAIGVMLPHVVRYNQEAVAPLYAKLAADAELCPEDDPVAAELLAELLEMFASRAGMPATLAECGVERSTCGDMAEQAAAQWTARFNPRPVDADALRELYECAISPSSDDRAA
ncbi:MAG: iron-containing alcohol dehydrogenase [Planctomycetaceae bacterium]